MKKLGKRLLSWVLVLTMTVQLSGGALAAVGDLLGNTPTQNQEIYNQLAAMTGGTSEQARALLQRLGLLNEKGELDLTAEITMDGETMTVEDVWALLDDPEVELDRIVNVDGTPVALADLKTMLQIEAELARIQETYFSGKTFGEEATDNLNSLMNQIENEGISLFSETRAASTGAAPYWVFSHDTLIEDQKLTMTLMNAPSEAVTFSVAKNAPTMRGETFTVTAAVGSEAPITIETTPTEITVPAGTTSVVFTSGITKKGDDITNFFIGDLQFTNPVGAGFNSTLSYGHTVKIQYQRGLDFSWKYIKDAAGSDGVQLYTVDYVNAGAKQIDTNGGWALDGEPTELYIYALPKAEARGNLSSSDMKQVDSIAKALSNIDLQARQMTLDMSAEMSFNAILYQNKYKHTPDPSYAALLWPAGIIHDAYHESSPMYHQSTYAYEMIEPKEDGALNPTWNTWNGDKPLISTASIQPTIIGGTNPTVSGIMVDVYTRDAEKLGGWNIWNPGGAPGQQVPTAEEKNTQVYVSLREDPFRRTKAPRLDMSTVFTMTTGVPDAACVLSDLDNYGLSMKVDLSNSIMKFEFIDGKVKEAKYTALAGYRGMLIEDGTNNSWYKNYFSGVMKGAWMKITETSVPTIQSVTAPAGEYFYGQRVPVTVKFSEPVECGGLQIKAQGGTQTLTCSCKNASAADGISASDTHVFYYIVPKADNKELYVNSISGVQDVFGNKMENPNTESRKMNNVTLNTCLIKDAVTAVAAGSTTIEPSDAAAGTTLKLTLDTADGFQTKYPLYPEDAVITAPDQKAPFVARLQGGTALIPFTLTETNGKINGATANTGALEFGTTANKTYTYDILAYELGSDSNWSTTPVPTGKSVSITVKPMVFVNGVTIQDNNEKTNVKLELSLTSGELPALEAKFTGNPTYKTGKWSSSNANVATIHEKTGKIALTGQSLEDVFFIFTADDGGQTGSSYGEAARKATTEVYTVSVGAEAGLVVPKGGNHIVTREGMDAQVRWYGNLAQYLDPKNSTHVTYTLEVFKGNLPANTDFTAPGIEKVYTKAELPIETTLHDIPVGTLTEPSIGGTPAYTVRVSAPHPNKISADSNIKLYAYAYILVNPIPPTVKLTPPTSLYALDSTQTSTVSWDIQNFKDTTTTTPTTATMTVERVNEAGAVESVIAATPLTTATGTQDFSLQEVPENELRALYVVTVRARNADTEPWSTDSYQFYVYNANALDIVVGEGKEELDSITLSNRNNDMDTLPKDTSAIMALRSKLGLNTPVGINYSEYAWSALKDGISWKSADDTKVVLNFKQGSFYEDIRRFNYPSYLPATTMAISGVGETEKTTVTATHANTGMSTTLDVKVETLQNRLYLFQATPMLKTTLTYTDGTGTPKTMETNDKGTLALYEPSGIKSPVHFRAVDTAADNTLYLGTIFAENLRSGEKNTLVSELYPLNAITLRKVARTDLFLKKPDGTPYVGDVTVRGGVYKNGFYCQDAQLGINERPLADGKTAQTVTTDATGKLTIQMDVTQFWSTENKETADNNMVLQADDKLEYIFELTGMAGSCPLLQYVDGVAPVEIGSRTGESVLTLDAGTTPQAVLTWQEGQDKNGDVRNIRKRAVTIGANETTPGGTDLVSTVLLWGETNLATKDYTVTALDEFGYKPAAQKSETITYPFSSLPVVRNTLTLTPDSMTKSGWIVEGDTRGLKLQVAKSGILQKEMPTDIKAVDLSKAPPLRGETTKNIMVDLTQGSAMPAPGEMTHDNKVVGGLMKLLGDTGGPISTSNFKMIISPGEDATTFKAFIWAGYNSMGLEDANYDGDGLSVNTKILEDDLSGGFGGEEAAELAGGAAKEAAQTGADYAKSGKSVSGGGSFGGQLEGYYDSIIKYNFKSNKWEIFTVGGGFTVGFGGSFGKTINQMAGPIPITASFELGAAIQLDFKMASRYKVVGPGLEWANGQGADGKDPIPSQYATDFLTTLRINAYFEAFGGVGFDFTIVALKFGIFGRISVDNSNAFLSRTYLKNSDLHQLNGQVVQLAGEVGIEFVVSVIGIEYKATLASVGATWNKKFNDWTKIQDYWDSAGSGLENQLAALASMGAMNGMALVGASATMESRSYLDDFDRSWVQPKRGRAIDVDNGVSALQTNAYPNSFPRITDDGQYLLYAFDSNSADLADTRIYATAKSGTAYPQGTEIPAPDTGTSDIFAGFGDSALRLAGTQNFAVAAWIRQNTAPILESGENIEPNTQAVLMNSTEIVASVNTGTGWTSTRITNNGTPDMSPVVATNGKSGAEARAIVAWRSVYSGDSAKPMDFTTQDNVLYQIYDGSTSTWGPTKTLYAGTSGAIKGIEAAILPDGTAAVTYSLDRSGTGDTSTYEMACSIVDTTGEPGRSLMLTNDSYMDENPQIVAVNCGTDVAPDQRFVIGWYSTRNGVGDIRMASLDAGGLPSATFPESLGQIANSVTVGNNFRFVAADKLENLSILWSLAGQNQSVAGDRLLAVKFLPEGNKIGLSAAIDVATLEANTALNHFDAYVSDPTANEIKAVIQGTQYLAIDESDPDTYVEYEQPSEDENGNPITGSYKVPKSKTTLYTATETYKNTMTLSGLWADYDNLAPNSLIPLQFTVANSGFKVLESVSVALNNGTPQEFPVNLAPNESITLTLYHAVGGTIADVAYSITPTFGGTPLSPTSGTLHLNYPDVGIAKLQVTGEQDGERDLRFTFYNGSNSKLKDSGCTLKIALYDDPLMDENPLTTATPLTTLTVSDNARLALADDGALCLDHTFNLDAYLASHAGLPEDGEVPATGVRLYAKAWLEKTVGGSAVKQAEFNTANNISSVQLDSLLTRAETPVTVSVAQSLANGKTVAAVTVRNNSLKPVAGKGNITATLLDQDGKALETQQSYQPATRGRSVGSDGLITLGKEGSETVTFTFAQAGDSVKVAYGELAVGAGEEANADLSTLSLTGVPLRLSDFVVDETDPTKFVAEVASAATGIRLTLQAKNPTAVVTVNGQPYTADMSLPTSGTVTVVVTAPNGTNTKTYEIKLVSSVYSSGSNDYIITARAGIGGTISPKGSTSVPFYGKLTYTITPNEGFEIKDVLVDSVSVGAVGTYAFEKVTKWHTIEASFAPKAVWVNPFSDVAETAWYYSAVRYVNERGLLMGSSPTTFSPAADTTRATLMTILARMDGVDTSGGATWYEKGMAWAMEKGISDGRNPGGVITREQLATMLHRYAGSPAVQGTLDDFPDAHRAGSWAMDGLRWAVETGIVTGKDGNRLDPLGKASRSEVATMLMRFVQISEAKTKS